MLEDIFLLKPSNNLLMHLLKLKVNMEKKVWVFNGNNSRFASGIFEDFVNAEAWIKENKLSGILTLYPLDKGVYQWATENKLFTARSEKHTTPEFIGAFTTASQEHYHYEDGVR